MAIANRMEVAPGVGVEFVARARATHFVVARGVSQASHCERSEAIKNQVVDYNPRNSMVVIFAERLLLPHRPDVDHAFCRSLSWFSSGKRH